MKILVTTAMISFILFGFVSCEKEKEKQEFTLGLDMQGWYIDDIVELRLDGSRVFMDTISLFSFSEPAAAVTLLVKEGSHKLFVVVNQNQSLQRQIELNMNLYVGIIFDEANDTITLDIQDEPFFYQ